MCSFPRPLTEKTALSLLEWLDTLVKNQLDRVCEGLLLGFLFSSIGFYVCMPVLLCFDYYSFVVSFEIRKYESFTFVLLLQDCFGYSGSLKVMYELWDFFSLFPQKKTSLGC